MPTQKKRRWLICLLLMLAILIPASIGALSYYTFSGEHQDEICSSGAVPDLSSEADLSAALQTSVVSKKNYPAPVNVTLNLSVFKKYAEFRTTEQLGYAKTIVGVAVARGLTTKGIQLTLAVPIEETGLRNLYGGHADSIGLFQQRPSQGWGTPKQVHDPVYATNRFIDEMQRIVSKKELATSSLYDLALKVQRPRKTAYARHWPASHAEVIATSVVSGLRTGGQEGIFDTTPLESDAVTASATSGCDNPCATGGNFTSVGTIRVATWNANFQSSEGNVKDGMRDVASQADVIGMQERGPRSHAAAALDGAGSDFKIYEADSQVPILVRTSKFEVIAHGYHQVFGIERVENAASGIFLGPRGVSWVTLKVKATGSIITLINNHIVPSIDHGGVFNQLKRRVAIAIRQLTAITKLVDEKGKLGPVFVTGDFNFAAEDDVKKKSANGPYMTMARHGVYSNWNDLGYEGKGTDGDGHRKIDYVWSTRTTAAQATGQILLPKHNSDHSPVVVSYAGSAAQKSGPVSTPELASLQNNAPQPPSSNPGNADGDADIASPDTGLPGGICDENGQLISNLSEMLKFAQEQIGKSYVLADGNPNNNTFDCSELTQLAFKAAGVTLPRVAMAQYNATKKDAVTRDQLRKGDLLFFNTIPSNNVLVDHVGIYMGDNKILHAPNPNKLVGIYDLGDNNDYYWPKFVGASRPIQTVSLASQGVSGDWQFPLAKRYAITSLYGMRVHPVTHVYKLHDGNDYGAPAGTPILAVASGTVQSAGGAGCYGNYTTIVHDGGKVVTGYAHQTRIIVHAGQHVSAGQVIGYVGGTGCVTGAHLHFSVRVIGHNGDSGNGHDDWVNSNTFITDAGYRAKLLGEKNDFSVAA